MLLTSLQAGALADFAEEGTEVVIASAIFDPTINPERLVCFRSDGRKVVIDRDGITLPYNGELNRKRKPQPVEELLSEDDVEVMRLERGES